MENKQLIDAAMPLRADIKRTDVVHTGGVACALETESGSIITGVCLDASCGIGFCAEHSAIAELAKTNSMRIVKIVAVNWNGAILPPCGRCRELMYQIDSANADTRVVLALDKDVALSELLPVHWQQAAA
jgi:cytidine deaminase